MGGIVAVDVGGVGDAAGEEVHACLVAGACTGGGEMRLERAGGWELDLV